MQRAQRNVPLYLAEERLREDKEEEKLLMLAEKHKDEQFFQREQVNTHTHTAPNFTVNKRNHTVIQRNSHTTQMSVV